MDLQAFKQHIVPVQARLFRLAQMFLRNREEAEDATQNVLLKLWTNRQKLDSYQSVEALAVQMTRNECLDRIKSHSRKKMAHDFDMKEVKANQISPYKQVENADNASLIGKLIGELPEQQKLVLHLRDVEEYSFQEIEKVTGLSAANIRVILSRARQRLRENYLKDNDYEPGY
ncbi:RNA polymerase sigma factor [Dyadobacter sp. 3J3]|uniref:RNA polymerase sigma factor n=1 Tax=Dyadobacter sp. 3J3 TaxID=2606600 RepID=UPI00135BC29F|nr:sigma-70 family RNA polymerase sigma factor [Dyadobacter sp. 3J3]